jgi:hypothetical protein
MSRTENLSSNTENWPEERLCLQILGVSRRLETPLFFLFGQLIGLFQVGQFTHENIVVVILDINIFLLGLFIFAHPDLLLGFYGWLWSTNLMLFNQCASLIRSACKTIPATVLIKWLIVDMSNILDLDKR